MHVLQRRHCLQTVQGSSSQAGTIRGKGEFGEAGVAKRAGQASEEVMLELNLLGEWTFPCRQGNPCREVGDTCPRGTRQPGMCGLEGPRPG